MTSRNHFSLLKLSVKALLVLTLSCIAISTFVFADNTGTATNKTTDTTTDNNANQTLVGQIIGASDVEFPDWFKESFLDFREDAEEAAEEGKHMLVFADLKGCPYCAKMLEDNFKTAEKDGGNLEFIKENFDSIHINIKGSREIAFNEQMEVTESELAKALKVLYTPTLLFMNADNKVVARLNGYRTPREFKTVLNYVKDKAYETTDLASYRSENLNDAVYELLPNKHFTDITDFQKASEQDKPIAILFEDNTCGECEAFHKDILTNPDIDNLMKAYNFARLDALSDKEIIDIDGNKTTAKDWIKKLGISYRPALVLYAESEEKARVTGLLKTFHMTELLTYVADKEYETYATWLEFGKVYQENILKSGKDIDIWK
ncbi:thioredoxin fold domain-containing protein [Cocleimonas sp. KMM 6892]|uniref:thioredoxin family protein n=1 Tax=unclassified Cocleimonas TaxID=2639732 RepID=UPI002DB7FFFC|nr:MULTISPECIES: thioredoxin fold domain-containing protein [unclassified Cocleimonas]MEB8431927.1 thioredoxin fold domain-containing protein [Cocleimonas sp. KMM 6892]MEC4714987.1 thioredoxin fold domain-containing protein [Cocleimonas sp. KMM 6895]MEC4744199.1 thioredoxin fold domain-containing protein [Cocleimonas sp. KMM 6896]